MVLDASTAPETHAIIGALIEVHKELGPGYLENIYHKAAIIEFGMSGLPHAHEVDIPIWYKGERLNCHYRADFVCFGDILVEFKAQDSIGDAEQGQMLNYLKATGFRLGLLVNFGEARLKVLRFLRDDHVVSVDSVSSVDSAEGPQQDHVDVPDAPQPSNDHGPDLPL